MLLVSLLKEKLEYVTEDGEHWKQIDVPDFRVSDWSTSWRFVSNRGRLLANDGTIMGQDIMGGYKQTCICIKSPGGVMGINKATYVHMIVAYTFLGPPSDPEMTVDHINGDCTWNHVSNLRWALPNEQCENRRCLSFKMAVYGQRDDIQVVSFLGNAAKLLGMRSAVALRCWIAYHTEVGKSYDINSKRVVVLEKSLSVMKAPQNEVRASKRKRERRSYEKILDLFLSGKTVTEIHAGWDRQIKRESLLASLCTGVKASTSSVVSQLAVRVGLGDQLKREELFHVLDKARIESDTWDSYCEKASEIVSEYTSEEADTVLKLIYVIMRILDDMEFSPGGWV